MQYNNEDCNKGSMLKVYKKIYQTYVNFLKFLQLIWQFVNERQLQ